MARKKREESSGGNAPWLNTFADLMNLLLCFFVMLFAMSDIDSEKFEKISISMQNTFSIFDGGGSAIGEGQLISAGMTQLNNLDEYYSNMGEDDKSTEKDKEGAPSDGEDISLDEAAQKVKEEMSKLTEKMYDEASDLSDKYKLSDYIELSIDKEGRFVLLSIKGSVLFESGKAEIMDEAKPILDKLGDLLENFDKYTIEIVGHTDNVPMTSGTYKNNNWLSSARALNAAEYLIEKHELDAKRIKYSGRGEYEPIASNDTKEGKAKNRRIEIRIYNELSGF